MKSVLGAAVLRTLPEVATGILWVNPHRIDLVRNQVHFAGKARNPEAMIPNPPRTWSGKSA